MLTSKRRVYRAARGSPRVRNQAGCACAGAPLTAQGSPRALRQVPAQECVSTCRFPTGSAPSPCASRAAPGGVGSAGGQGPLLRLRQDGPVAPGQGSRSPGSKAPLLLLLKGGLASASTAAAPGNAGGRGGWVVWDECQFSAEGGLRPPSRARTASAQKPVSPLGASKPADIPGLSSVLFVALKFQEESQRSNG